MTENEQLFLEMTRRAIAGHTEKEDIFNSIDWKIINQLACDSKLYPFMYELVKNQSGVDETLLKMWDRGKAQVFLKQSKDFLCLRTILQCFDSMDIMYAVFKGNIIAAAYPNPYYRVTCDNDILVKEEDFDKAKHHLEMIGYQFQPENSKDSEYGFENLKTHHRIEIHTTIFGDYDNEHIRILKKNNVGNLENLITVTINGYDVKTLNHTEHLIFMMYHLIKHFMLGGGNIRFFTDVALFCNYYEEYIDINRFWSIMDESGYGEFGNLFFGICEKYFDLSDRFVRKNIVEFSDEKVEKLIRDFMYCGDEKNLRTQQYSMMSVMSSYFNGENNTKKLNVFRVLFPPYSTMVHGYKYLQNKPILLPIAWIHRIWNKVCQMITGKSGSSVKEELDQVSERLELIHDVGLL